MLSERWRGSERWIALKKARTGNLPHVYLALSSNKVASPVNMQQDTVPY